MSTKTPDSDQHLVAERPDAPKMQAPASLLPHTLDALAAFLRREQMPNAAAVAEEAATALRAAREENEALRRPARPRAGAVDVEAHHQAMSARFPKLLARLSDEDAAGEETERGVGA